MEKSIKITYALLILAVIAAVIHNAIFGIFRLGEVGFFTLTLLLFLAFLIAIAVNVVTFIKSGTPKDLRLLGWIGLFGIIGILPGANIKFFYAFFGFFAFFGLKK